MVKENDAVIHSFTSDWNTPDERSAWVIAEIKKPEETQPDGQIPAWQRKRRTAHPRYLSMPEWE